MEEEHMKTYRVLIERRIIHAIEVKGKDLTPAQARDMVYESQVKGANCHKHSAREKKSCQTIVEIIDTEIYENKEWKVL